MRFIIQSTVCSKTLDPNNMSNRVFVMIMMMIITIAQKTCVVVFFPFSICAKMLKTTNVISIIKDIIIVKILSE